MGAFFCGMRVKIWRFFRDLSLKQWRNRRSSNPILAISPKKLLLTLNVFQEEPKDLKMDKSTENDAYDESKENGNSQNL